MYGYQVPRLLSERKVLDSVCIVPLIFWCDFPLKAPQSERRRSVNSRSLLQSLSGKKLPPTVEKSYIHVLLTRQMVESYVSIQLRHAVTYFSNPNRIIVHIV